MSKDKLRELLSQLWLQDISADEAFDELEDLINHIKRLEEELMEVKNKHSVLVADVALDEDRADRIHRLEDRIHRAAMAFFRDGSDGHVASQMLQILEEERGKP